MIRKTVREFKRIVTSWDIHDSEQHIERVKRETWWFLWILPVYSRESIVTTNL